MGGVSSNKLTPKREAGPKGMESYLLVNNSSLIKTTGTQPLSRFKEFNISIENGDVDLINPQKLGYS
jgi:hypothetical protein